MSTASLSRTPTKYISKVNNIKGILHANCQQNRPIMTVEQIEVTPIVFVGPTGVTVQE